MLNVSPTGNGEIDKRIIPYLHACTCLERTSCYLRQRVNIVLLKITDFVSNLLLFFGGGGGERKIIYWWHKLYNCLYMNQAFGMQ